MKVKSSIKLDEKKHKGRFCKVRKNKKGKRRVYRLQKNRKKMGIINKRLKARQG